MRAQRLLVALAVATAWVSAREAPLVDALAGARRPIDFVRDYVTAEARVHLGRGASLVGEAGNAYAATLGAPPVVLLGGPYHLHPPTALLPMLTLTPLRFEGAAFAWLVLSLAALGALAFFVAVALTRRDRPPAGVVAATFAALLLWPPVLHNLEKGQWSIVLAALIAAGEHALARERPRAAGVCLGIAASLKVTPALLLLYLLLRHRRAAAAMIGTAIVAGLASLAVSGVGPWIDFATNVPRNVAAWQTWIANTGSVNGLVSRLFVGGLFARPWIEAPGLGRALDLAAGAVLVALAGASTSRAPRTPAAERRLFAAWTILVVLLNPLAWSHSLVIAVVPFALLADGPLVSAAFVLATIPRETLAVIAGPLPVLPARGLALSVHALALLLLFAAARAAATLTRPA